MATDEPFFWVLAGLFILRHTDADSKELGRWVECFCFTQTVNQGLCQAAQMLYVSQSTQIFHLVVILHGKENFPHFKDVNAFTQCFILAYALSLLLRDGEFRVNLPGCAPFSRLLSQQLT